MRYRITVLISTYNNRQFVEKKIKEIETQSIFPDVEFLFIETASPEKEREFSIARRKRPDPDPAVSSKVDELRARPASVTEQANRSRIVRPRAG